MGAWIVCKGALFKVGLTGTRSSSREVKRKLLRSKRGAWKSILGVAVFGTARFGWGGVWMQLFLLGKGRGLGWSWLAAAAAAAAAAAGHAAATAKVAPCPQQEGFCLGWTLDIVQFSCHP